MLETRNRGDKSNPFNSNIHFSTILGTGRVVVNGTKCYCSSVLWWMRLVFKVCSLDCTKSKRVQHQHHYHHRQKTKPSPLFRLLCAQLSPAAPPVTTNVSTNSVVTDNTVAAMLRYVIIIFLKTFSLRIWSLVPELSSQIRNPEL